MSQPTTRAAILGLALLGLISHASAQRYVPGDEAEFPRVQYADSSISVNDRCIVRLRKLSPKMPPVYVNGKPIGFC